MNQQPLKIQLETKAKRPYRILSYAMLISPCLLLLLVHFSPYKFLNIIFIPVMIHLIISAIRSHLTSIKYTKVLKEHDVYTVKQLSELTGYSEKKVLKDFSAIAKNLMRGINDPNSGIIITEEEISLLRFVDMLPDNYVDLLHTNHKDSDEGYSDSPQPEDHSEEASN